MKKIKISILILILIIIPVLINILMFFKLPFTSVYSGNNPWLGFWASYISGIIGGAFTLIGVILTFRKTDKDARANEERRKTNINLAIKDELQTNKQKIENLIDHPGFSNNLEIGLHARERTLFDRTWFFFKNDIINFMDTPTLVKLSGLYQLIDKMNSNTMLHVSDLREALQTIEELESQLQAT